MDSKLYFECGVEEVNACSSEPVPVDFDLLLRFNAKVDLELLFDSVLQVLQVLFMKPDLEAVGCEVDNPSEGLHINQVVVKRFDTFADPLILLSLEESLLSNLCLDLIRSSLNDLVNLLELYQALLESFIRLEVWVKLSLDLNLLES